MWSSGQKWAGEWRDDNQISKTEYSHGFYDTAPIKQTNYTPYIVVLAIIIAIVISGLFLRWEDKNYTSNSRKQESTLSAQQEQSATKNKSSEFKSKVEDSRWKKDKLKSTQSSKSSNCPHCEESISADVLVCPFCAEAVTIEAVTIENAIKPPEEVVIEKTVKETLPPSGEISPVKTKIRKLEALLADGVISQKEFNSRKQKLIDEHLNV